MLALLCHALCVLLVPIDVGYEFTVYTTTEGEGFVTLCAVVMNSDEGSPGPFVVSATTDDGEASKLDFEEEHLNSLSIQRLVWTMLGWPLSY